MPTYTPEQIDAAKTVAAANHALTRLIDDEPPLSETDRWRLWNDRWQNAYQKHEDAEDRYRALFPDQPAPAVAAVLLPPQSANPLRPTLTPHVWHTLDNAFVTNPYEADSDRPGMWGLDWYGIPDVHAIGTTCLTLVVADLTHAQQMVDQILWAMSAGARDRSEAVPA